MATSAKNLHLEKEREKETARPTDMGFILHLFPKDVRIVREVSQLTHL